MIKLTDVTLRDGLQSESRILSTPEKMELYTLLSACGYARLELTSFVRPDRIPPLADAEAFLTAAAGVKSGAELMAFVPNVKGLERFAKFPLAWATTFVAATEEFNQKNVGRSINDTLAELKLMAPLVKAQGRKLRIYVSTVFGCPYEGKVKDASLFSTLEKVAAIGPDEIALSDTIGVALPEQVQTILRKFKTSYPPEKTALHLHNTYGLALMNLDAGYAEGVRLFDGSTGGVGGCPYAKGATGNMPSEGIAYYFERRGKLNSLNWVKVKETVQWLRTHQLSIQGPVAGVIEKGGKLYGVE